jgi:hypothetical protein
VPESGPSVWTAILADPTLPFDRATLRLVVRDQRRWTRTWLYPWVRVVARIAVWLILVVKRLVPLRFSAHSTMDTLCVWFLRRFVSPEAGELLIRHFIVETNLLNFLVRNAALPGLREVTLVPTTLPELGNRAVIQHDLNVYDVLIGLGTRAEAVGGLDPWLAGRTPALDFSMLRVPPVDASPGTRRLLRLDIQTALCLMNIPFALCLTGEEYRRAVHSMKLDASLMSLFTRLTGDPEFLAWRPAGSVVRVDSSVDVPAAVYEHAVICEYAHARLLRLARSSSSEFSSTELAEAGAPRSVAVPRMP